MARLAGKDGDAAADLIQRLQSPRWAVSFFQIVRLFNNIARRSGARRPGGVASRPQDDSVHFRAALGMRHFASEIIAAEMRASDNVPELTVLFSGFDRPIRRPSRLLHRIDRRSAAGETAGGGRFYGSI